MTIHGPILIAYDHAANARTAIDALRDLDAAALDASERLATEGAAFPEKAGHVAEPRVSSVMATAAKAMVQATAQDDTRLIVHGTHRRGSLTAALLGNVSTKVRHHTQRPTLIVPPGESAEK